MAREEPTIWGCEHHYPIVVEKAEHAKRARCLGCGASGPERSGAEQAMLALRAEARYGQRLGVRPPVRRSPDHIGRAFH
jgi:hypothetical protein